VLEQLPVPVLAVANDGGILFANPAFGEMLGYDRETVRSLNLADIVDTAAHEESAVSVIRHHAGQLVSLSHADGAVIRAIVSKSALERFDDEIALITFQDLTEQLWLEGH
jgi:PAS domain S-box-containing protein